MKISYNWLREYAPVAVPPEEIAEILTRGGLEVDDVEHIGSSMEGVVVGHVVKTWPHPNADRLTICEVDVGAEKPVRIVCGAPNVATGLKVPVATVGTTLLLPSRQNPQEREPVTITRAKLRGETSEGMICAEDELGLSEDHSGIMVLDESGGAGQPFVEYLAERGLETSDAILDVSVTPNRPDATSHIGVARDAAALAGTTLAIPPIELPQNGGEAAEQVSVQIEAPDGCPRYVALLVRDVRVGDSPAWLKQRLISIGLRPRNNVVDVTNFVLHECGQPLHAFDFDEIAGATIRVRRTGGETKFTTLDSRERTLPKGTLMICDADRDVAIAGVMGGENSEVAEKTTNVLIESAYFDPTSIRRTAKALGLQTDASYRFERGVDRDGQVWAAARAARLISELTGGTVVDGMVDAQPITAERRTIVLRPSRVHALLGVHISAVRISELLESIGFEIEKPTAVPEYDADLMERLSGEEHPESADGAVMTFTVPTYRPDVEREVDVIEEIVRLFGYDNVPEPDRSTAPARAPRDLPEDRLRGSARALLSSVGYRETYTNSMLRVETARKFSAGGEIVETLNPISQEMAALRPSLLPGTLQVMSFNRKHGQRVLRFFEFGHVYLKAERSDNIIPGFAEHESFIVAASGPATMHGWDVKERLMDLYDLKGVVERLLGSIRLPDLRLEATDTSNEITGNRLNVFSGETHLGELAQLSDEIGHSYDLKEPVFFAELNWKSVVSLATSQMDRRYRAVDRYPTVERDIAVVVDAGEPASRMMRTIERAGGDLLKLVGVFDLYEGEHVGPGRKSIAFSLRFGADRTLTDDEVDARVAVIVASLEQEHGASLRR